MPTHPDAIGYIRDLWRSEGIPWLEMICDLAVSGETTISPHNLEIIVQIFIGRASYISQSTPATTPATTGTIPAASERLEFIGGFNGFKRLSDTLEVLFPKRATIVFGANGSGKSSLCEALQILASHDAPKRPLHDVRAAETATPSFAFKFTSDATNQNWTSPGTYGSRSSILKYFDSEIAIHNIENPVQPGRIVELSPFKLDVFETAENHCKQLRAELQRRQSRNLDSLNSVVEQIHAKFKPFEGAALAALSSPTTAMLEFQIKLGEAYAGESDLTDKFNTKKELEKATSEEGIKLLKGEVAALKALREEIEPILKASQSLMEIDSVAQSIILKEKEKEQETLARALIPSGATLHKLMALIRPANEICTLHSPETAECPLCKQVLRESELDLFKQYSALLTGELDTEIFNIRKSLEVSKNHLRTISDASPDAWAKDSVLPSDKIEAVKVAGKAIQARFNAGREIDQASKDLVVSLQDFSKGISDALENKEKLIAEAGSNRDDLLAQLAKVSAEYQSLLYAKGIAENINLLKDVCQRAKWVSFWNSKLPIFTSVLRKVTNAAKKTHTELVVDDFKTRLNAEYVALAEKNMDAFGVEVKNVGGDGAVTVNHCVAGQRIEVVLSEGEQRIHALALFFAEIETCEQQVIVFDDPISSFDYNYTANYCNRLRDLIQKYPNRQIIVMTHSWEFFVQIQTTLNRSQLNDHMAVYVLENCVAIDQYSENIDNLKSEIESVLTIPDEPTKSQKEVMAGNMRRLIEAIVNTHVFNKQRHQFKQKTQQISVFDEFTRIVPLCLTEAASLRDLFAKLSISEHDDPRNAYVNTDKAMFQTRYAAIKGIESEIVGRK